MCIFQAEIGQLEFAGTARNGLDSEKYDKPDLSP